MTFIAPLLAGMTALGAVPIIIWLLNRNRYKVVRWPALEFLLRMMRQRKRRLRLREIILLILRTSAVVLTALALARPLLAGGKLDGLGLGKGAAVVVLDNSMSMAALEGLTSRLDLAKTKAQEIVARLPRGSSAALVLQSDVADSEFTEPSQDLAYVAQAIVSAPQSGGGSNLAMGLSKALEILRDTQGHREIYLISDMQAGAWPSAVDGAWREITERLAQPDAPTLFLVDSGNGGDDGNIQVESLSIEDPLATMESPTPFTVRLRHSGTDPVLGAVVELWVDDSSGEMRKAGSGSVATLEGAAELRIPIRLEPGLRRVEARVRSDRQPGDDARHLVVEAVDKVRVLLIRDEADRREEGAAFLSAAISPLTVLQRGGAVGDDADLFQLDVRSVSDLSGIDLSSYRMVIVHDVQGMPPATVTALRAWTAEGRGLLLMPGKRNSASTWTEAFTELSSVQIAGGIREPKDASGGKGIGFSTEGLVHPIVSYFTAPVPRRFFAAPRFWRVHDLKPTSDAGVLLRLADGTPAMIEHTLGRGSVITTAFPCEKAWSDLPLRPVFLMLMRRTIQYASLGNRPQLNVQVNETARLPITVHQAGSGVRWRDPRGGTGTLNPAESAGGALALELADTRFSGFYRLEGQEWRTWVAANPPAAESDSRPLTSEEALARCQPAHAYWVGSGEAVADRIENARGSGVEIWKPLLAVAVMCLIAETLLVLLWTPKRA